MVSPMLEISIVMVGIAQRDQTMKNGLPTLDLGARSP